MGMKEIVAKIDFQDSDLSYGEYHIKFDGGKLKKGSYLAFLFLLIYILYKLPFLDIMLIKCYNSNKWKVLL